MKTAPFGFEGSAVLMAVELDPCWRFTTKI